MSREEKNRRWDRSQHMRDCNLNMNEYQIYIGRTRNVDRCGRRLAARIGFCPSWNQLNTHRDRLKKIAAEDRKTAISTRDTVT